MDISEIFVKAYEQSLISREELAEVYLLSAEIDNERNLVAQLVERGYLSVDQIGELKQQCEQVCNTTLTVVPESSLL